MTRTQVCKQNANMFPQDSAWQEHCARVAAYLEYVAKTGKEPPLSPEAEAQVERAMRRYEARERRERDHGTYDEFTGSYMTEAERFSQ